MRYSVRERLDLPLSIEFAVFVVVEGAEKCQGVVLSVDIPVIERPGASSFGLREDLDLWVGAVVHVQHMIVTPSGYKNAIDELVAILAKAEVGHVDDDLSPTKALPYRLWVLAVTGIEVTCLSCLIASISSRRWHFSSNAANCSSIVIAITLVMIWTVNSVQRSAHQW